MSAGSPEAHPQPRLTLEPIGYVRGPLASKFLAARQPAAAPDTPSRIELLAGRSFEHALEDLAAWKLIWIIFWFHQNPGWRPKVLPPRSTSGRKGVFATRSPHRPNPIGMSVVRLEGIDGLTLRVRGSDMLDGTPVLDLKPYVAYTDAHPDAGNGWLECGAQLRVPQDPVAAYAVHFSPLAATQAAWIEARTALAVEERTRAILALGPMPHPYRRIRKLPGGLQLAVKEWRVHFALTGREVSVLQIDSGYRDSQLKKDTDGSLRAHTEFLAAWPRAPAL
jgi:tRNA-Thr(GGU) m(6)t(6)A37 methyltransferase TsaA